MNTYKHFFLLVAFFLFIVDAGAEAIAEEEPSPVSYTHLRAHET